MIIARSLRADCGTLKTNTSKTYVKQMSTIANKVIYILEALANPTTTYTMITLSHYN